MAQAITVDTAGFKAGDQLDFTEARPDWQLGWWLRWALASPYRTRSMVITRIVSGSLAEVRPFTFMDWLAVRDAPRWLWGGLYILLLTQLLGFLRDATDAIVVYLNSQ